MSSFETTNSNNLVRAHFLVFFLILSVLFYFLPFSLFGQDAYMGWGPIIAEYLKGDDHFRNSLVTFGGQDLLAIYGYLPFWKICRFFNLNFIQTENYTYLVFLSLIQYYTVSLYKHLKQEFGVIDFFCIIFYTIFCPIFFHRIYSGHINLLFAILPSFVILNLMINHSRISLLINTITLWFAFTIQGYQLIAYNLFYIPLYYAFFRDYGIETKVVFKNAMLVLIVGLALAAPTIYEIALNALSSQNIRKVGVNMVYSYSPMEIQDMVHFVFESLANPIKADKFYGFFHEIAYPMGITSLIFILQPQSKRLKISLFFIFIFLCLFCFNLPPGSWFAKIPIMSSFRVPQRSFMLLSYLVPLFVLSQCRWNFKLYDLFLPALSVSIFLVTPNYEIYTFFLLLMFFLFLVIRKKSISHQGMIVSCLLVLCLGSLDKIEFIKTSYGSFKRTEHQLKRAISQFEKIRPSGEVVFHIEALERAQLNATAKILGIKTMEGYGNPPKHLVEIYEKLTGQKFFPGQNHLYFDQSMPNYKKVLHEFGVNYVINI